MPVVTFRMSGWLAGEICRPAALGRAAYHKWMWSVYFKLPGKGG